MANDAPEIWSPAEKTRRNFRSKKAWGELIGACLIGNPLMLVGTFLAIRQCGRGERMDYVPDPDKFDCALLKRSATASQEARLKGDHDD